MANLQSLKKQQRVLSVIMFIAVFVVAVGPEALGQALPFVPQAILVGLASACAWYINFHQTESRVVRAEERKEEELIQQGIVEVDDDGI